MENLKLQDEEIFRAIADEKMRQEDHLELIASENYVSKAVLEAQGSILTNKYAEGYPGKRYYGGCQYVDIVENLAKERLKKLFHVDYVNVQPHSGSQANMAAYRALLNNGDRILGMALDHGGHLTHGYRLSFSGQDYVGYFYGVSKESETIDYDEVERKAEEVRPRLIVAGASAYPRTIDFRKFREIADKVGAYLMVDMAHIAGLVAAGLHPNPCGYADVVTSTTHKTLRGPRGGIILTKDAAIAEKIDKSVFPGVQGGPLMHVIAAKAVAFREALSEDFVAYQEQVIRNARALSEEFIRRGYPVVSGGTDNHLLLVDVRNSRQINGRDCERLLDSIHVTVNKNTIPDDKEKPMLASGIRLGSPALTTRGMKEREMKEIVRIIDEALKERDNPEAKERLKGEVIALCRKFPLEV